MLDCTRVRSVENRLGEGAAGEDGAFRFTLRIELVELFRCILGDDGTLL